MNFAAISVPVCGLGCLIRHPERKIQLRMQIATRINFMFICNYYLSIFFGCLMIPEQQIYLFPVFPMKKKYWNLSLVITQYKPRDYIQLTLG
jgi:hypothetical protein